MNHQPFVAWLVSNEYSPATIQKYTRALARFFAETGAGPAPWRRPSRGWLALSLLLLLAGLGFLAAFGRSQLQYLAGRQYYAALQLRFAAQGAAAACPPTATVLEFLTVCPPPRGAFVFPAVQKIAPPVRQGRGSVVHYWWRCEACQS